MNRAARLFFTLILMTMLLSSLSITIASGYPFDRSTYLIYFSDQTELRELAQLNLDVNRPNPGTNSLLAYLNVDEVNLVQSLGYRVEATPDQAYEMFKQLTEETAGTDDPMREYHTYEELVAELQSIVAAHPTLCHLYNVGPTIQGRALWFMKISDNVDVAEDEPEFKYISSIHGNEVVGKEMCMYLINYLMDNYGSDPMVNHLVNETEIWIMPSMNPDGTANGSRYNANGVDLNRNFPDRVDDPINTTVGREPETANVMNWNFVHQPVFSANFHCGTLVANYPWDRSFDPQANKALTPDNDVVLAASETYTSTNLPMWNNNTPPFVHGTVNGVDWYQIDGGMQDWNYFWMGDMDITMEISNVNWPSYSLLPGYWDDNRASMLAYMEYSHLGIRGLVKNAVNHQPLPANVTVKNRQVLVVSTDSTIGDYHRVLMPGTYDLDVTSYGYWPAHLTDIQVTTGDAVRQDFNLEPADLMTFSGILHNQTGSGLSARLTMVNTPYATIQTSTNGQFTFNNVYEGEYNLRIESLVDNALIEIPIVLNTGMNPLELWGPFIVMYDGFESGLGSWTPQGTWGTSGNHYAGSLSASDSPSGNYGSNLNISLTRNGAMDLTLYDYATLSYWVTYNCETNFDTLFCEISPNGSSWSAIDIHNSTQNWWSQEIRDVSTYAGSNNLRLRYRLKTDGSVARDGGFVDEVRVSAASTTPLSAPVLDVNISAINPPIVIPANGGSFQYNINVHNLGSTPSTFQIWNKVRDAANVSTVVFGPITRSLPGGANPFRVLAQTIAGSISSGTLYFISYIGSYPNNIADSSFFTITKSAINDGGPWIAESYVSGDVFNEYGVNGQIPLPDKYLLSQNYPNPFNPITKIHFALPKAGHVELKVFNTAGQLVTTLQDGYCKEGWHEVTWDASTLATGLYIYRMNAGGQTYSQKAILIK
ncbi:MAG: DUF2817 domain-containing protein [bacterium]|nr:DUF2817 domain-containing protein [bacterium]